ncbi:hypothetical protein L1999_24625 [Neobacillus drentensis]|uniref:hypothetical protein n=1 Tax=Neobacillus drentensis TaxID=220684 RepID=UPI001F17960E|nr:hypothetical protein [Neobacillus drentensis]ULT56197.1 hypothetical protein L1999_24625 [Neobacillus drentensis]
MKDQLHTLQNKVIYESNEGSFLKKIHVMKETANGEIGAVNALIADKKSQIEKLKATITDLNSQITALNDELQETKDELENAKVNFINNHQRSMT